MSDDPVTGNALRSAEGGAPADATRLVAAVPALMREAERRRNEARTTPPSLAVLATWALPRLAAATAVAVIAATWVVVRERNQPSAAAAPASFESVIIDGSPEGTGDVVFDALLDARRSDG